MRPFSKVKMSRPALAVFIALAAGGAPRWVEPSDEPRSVNPSAPRTDDFTSDNELIVERLLYFWLGFNKCFNF